MIQENSIQTMPKWITIYLWIATIMATMFSILAYFKPEVQFATWETLTATGATSLAGPIGLYIARNLATAFSGFYALTQKSFPMLKMLLVLRLITDGLDFAHNATAGNMQGGAFALIMFLIEAFALFKISKK
ncbi:MAG: hypothetical protein EAZ55_13310 [Cytophagales bacterium]|nr:MAG: hypothetical protein EAZ55_13310 [Cytophagales bacterium]